MLTTDLIFHPGSYEQSKEMVNTLREHILKLETGKPKHPHHDAIKAEMTEEAEGFYASQCCDDWCGNSQDVHDPEFMKDCRGMCIRTFCMFFTGLVAIALGPTMVVLGAMSVWGAYTVEHVGVGIGMFCIGCLVSCLSIPLTIYFFLSLSLGCGNIALRMCGEPEL